MNTILKMAWRNLWRNRRRTILTISAIAFSCAVLVFFVALQLSSYDTSINATLSVLQGHFQVQAQGYHQSPEMRETIAEPITAKQILQQLPEVSALATRAQGFALLSSGTRSVGAYVVGVEPSEELQISTIPKNVRLGRYLLDDDTNSIVLGMKLARTLAVELNSEITLLGQGWDGSVAASVVKVAGIFESGIPEVDRSFVEIPIETFQETFSLNKQAHALVGLVQNLQQIDATASKISLVLDKPQLRVLTWQELIPGLKNAIELDFIAGWLFYASLIIVVAFTVLNTFLMSVFERTREFGVMMALGTAPTRIVKLILCECLFVTILGIAIGIFLGSAITIYFGITGFTLPGSEEIAAHWHMPVDLHTRLVPLAFILGPGLLFLAAIIAVIYPAWKIQRLSTIEALHAI